MYKNHWAVRSAAAFLALLFLFPAPATAGTAADLVEEFNAALIAVMRAADRRLHERYEMLASPVERSFDLPFMLQQAAGSRWRAASEEDRGKLVAAFTRLSVGTFVFRFRDYEGESFTVVGESAGDNDTRLVLTEFVRPGKPPVPVTYVTRQFGTAWRIIDLLIGGGISELAVRRSEYAFILNQSGVSGLISRLNEKADQILSSDAAPAGSMGRR